MSKQDAIYGLCKCLEDANNRNRLKFGEVEERSNCKIVCGFRTGHRLTITATMPIYEPTAGDYYYFKCLDCRLEYMVNEAFTPREQELIDNLKKGVENG